MKLLAFLVITTLNACAGNQQAADSTQAKVEKISYRIVEQFPHDTTAFTEGFLFHNGQLFESTGSPDDRPESKSFFGPVDLKTGKVDRKVELEVDKYFGEGIVFIKNKVFQLTWQNQVCFVYDDKSFQKIGEYKFSNTEGWGMTTDGKNIIMSDGTSMLTYRDPDTFAELKTLQVTDEGKPVDDLNELEWIKGYIYANIWFTNTIVKIDPATGKVIAKLDMTALDESEKAKTPNKDWLNGIAYNVATDQIFVTGKLWSSIYRIEFPH